MKQCTKCKIEKELNQFYTYWHSTQQKQRVRGECNQCFFNKRKETKLIKLEQSNLIQVSIRPEIIQPVVLELQPDLSTDKNYKLCRTCQKYLELDKYYNHNSRHSKTYLDCKTCINKKEVQMARERRIIHLKENGGSERHFEKPNQWVDEYQKEATYNILKSIGWKLNEDNGIWWKDGIKTNNGVFINITPKKDLSFVNYPYTINTDEKKIMFDRAVKLRNEGMTFGKISDEVGMSQATIFKWLKHIKNGRK